MSDPNATTPPTTMNTVNHLHLATGTATKRGRQQKLNDEHGAEVVTTKSTRLMRCLDCILGETYPRLNSEIKADFVTVCTATVRQRIVLNAFTQ